MGRSPPPSDAVRIYAAWVGLGVKENLRPFYQAELSRFHEKNADLKASVGYTVAEERGEKWRKSFQLVASSSEAATKLSFTSATFHTSPV